LPRPGCSFRTPTDCMMWQRKLFRKIKEGKYHFHQVRDRATHLVINHLLCSALLCSVFTPLLLLLLPVDGGVVWLQDYWGNTSPEAIDMIRKMLCVNQKERWTAGQLLQHPWITLGEDVLGQKEMTKQLETLKKYRAKLRFKKAVLAVTVGVKVKLMFKNKTPSGTHLVDPSLDESAKADSAKAALTDGEGDAAAAAPAANAAATPGAAEDATTAEPSAVVLESRDSVDGADVAKEKEYVGVKAKKGKSGITAEMLKELQEMEARGEIEDDNGDVPAVERM
jgi:hypothetical protein